MGRGEEERILTRGEAETCFVKQVSGGEEKREEGKEARRTQPPR